MERVPIVLLVDDDDNDSLLFARAARRGPFPADVHRVENGQEAVDYLSGVGKYDDRVQHPFPQFIITDSRMPVMTGTDFLRWVKSHPQFCVIPTIIMGGATSDVEVDKAYRELGVHSYIIKPSDNSELQRIVNLILGYWTICAIPHCSTDELDKK